MGHISVLTKNLWVDYFKMPLDERPATADARLKFLRSLFFKISCAELYEFIEAIVESIVTNNVASAADHLESASCAALASEGPRMRYARGIMVCITLVLAATFASPPPLYAQRVLYSSGNGNSAFSAIINLQTGASTPLGPGFSSSIVFTADGQYVLRTIEGSAQLRLRHVPSGTEVALPASLQFTPGQAHPRDFAVYGAVSELGGGGTPGGLVPARLDPSGLRKWTPCGPPALHGGFVLTRDGTQLVGQCGDGRLVAIDAHTGVLLRQQSIGYPTALALSPDGTQAVVIRGFPAEIARIDTVTGATLLSRPWHDGAFGAVLFRSPDGEVVIENSCTAAPQVCTVRILDFMSLAERNVLSAAPSPAALVHIGTDGTVFVVSHEQIGTGLPLGTVSRVVVATGELLLRASAPQLWLRVADLPMRPSTLTANVSSGSVTLSWSLPAQSAAATQYRLAIGRSAGTSDLGSVTLGPAESFTATGVPPGRYFVRVHTVNYTGESDASNEVVVDVP
jgi:hypothetical protein